MDYSGINSKTINSLTDEKGNCEVMVVDDDPMIRMILCTIIKYARPGITLIECINGEDAYSKINKKICLIFTDNNMPVISGIELIRKLKAEKMYSQIPVVMVSAEGREEYRFLGKELGAAGWVVKPFVMSQIQEYLNQYL